MPEKFRGLGWNTIVVEDANDLVALQKAFDEFKKVNDKPTLIIVKSIIGFGSPNKANTHGAHGAPLGDEEIKLTKNGYGWPENEKFLVPADVPEYFAKTMGKRGQAAKKSGRRSLPTTSQVPKGSCRIASDYRSQVASRLGCGIKPFPADPKGLATRVSCGKVLNMLAPHLPSMIGGSADLAPSTMTLLDGQTDFGPGNYAGRNMHFGIREHGMASVLNGMTLSGLRAYGATFFVFTDYMRPSMRLASIMHQPVFTS